MVRVLQCLFNQTKYLVVYGCVCFCWKFREWFTGAISCVAVEYTIQLCNRVTYINSKCHKNVPLYKWPRDKCLGFVSGIFQGSGEWCDRSRYKKTWYISILTNFLMNWKNLRAWDQTFSDIFRHFQTFSDILRPAVCQWLRNCLVWYQSTSHTGYQSTSYTDYQYISDIFRSAVQQLHRS